LGLKARGLHGVEFVVADDHAGLRAALREVLAEAAYQRCYVHFLRNALDYVPRKVDAPNASVISASSTSALKQLTHLSASDIDYFSRIQTHLRILAALVPNVPKLAALRLQRTQFLN
jgi:transposase-like protein